MNFNCIITAPVCIIYAIKIVHLNSHFSTKCYVFLLQVLDFLCLVNRLADNGYSADDVEYGLQQFEQKEDQVCKIPLVYHMVGHCTCDHKAEFETFILVLQIDILSISWEIALICMPQNTFDDKSILVQVVAWCP